MKLFRSLRFQLVSGFIVVVAALFSFLFYNNDYAMNVVRSQVAEANGNLLNSNVKSLDAVLGAVNNYMYGTMLQDEDIKLLGLNLSEDDRFIVKRRISSRFGNTASTIPQVESFFVYTANHDDVTFYYGTIDLYPYLEAIIRDESENREGSDNVWRVISIADERKPYLIRILKMSDLQAVGAIVDVGAITDQFRLWDSRTDEGVTVLSREGAPLTPTGFSESMLKGIRGQFARTSSQHQIYAEPGNGTRYLAVTLASAEADIDLLYTVPEAKLLRSLPYFQRVIYMVPAGTCLLVLVYLLLLQRVLFTPMIRLIRGMQRLKRGDLDASVSGGDNYEMRVINQTFNEMVEEIGRLKIDVYEEQIKTKDAQFKRLQSQINPHFYLNSLNIVFSLAELKEYRLIQKMAQHLVDYMRFIMQNNREWVTLDQELTHIGNYLEIQSMRFQNLFHYTINRHESCMDGLIPPLIVQPFVENAIVHGFDIELGSFQVSISVVPDAESPERYCEVIVADNGPGFPPDKLERLHSGQFGGAADDRHVGIWNVNQRLKIKYGDEASMTFANGDRGAVVRLRLPVHYGAEGERTDVEAAHSR